MKVASILLLTGVTVMHLAACSKTKTVYWEEEVLLNTGETIWIERRMPWALQGGFGNPVVRNMLPTGIQTIQFVYAGREYRYEGRANVRWIAIASSKTPVLVARAGDLAWAKLNNYYCVTPYYVQLVPDESGKRWIWPEKIDPWLYQLPANIMAEIPSLEETPQARYTIRDRDKRDATYRLQSPTGARIEPLYKEDGCIHRVDVDMDKRPDWTRK